MANRSNRKPEMAKHANQRWQNRSDRGQQNCNIFHTGDGELVQTRNNKTVQTSDDKSAQTGDGKTTSTTDGNTTRTIDRKKMRKRLDPTWQNRSERRRINCSNQKLQNRSKHIAKMYETKPGKTLKPEMTRTLKLGTAKSLETKDVKILRTRYGKSAHYQR